MKTDQQKSEQSCVITFYVNLRESTIVTNKKLQRISGEYCFPEYKNSDDTRVL